VDLSEDFEAHVASAFGPFVVLLGEYRADQADQGAAVGQDPDDVGAAPDLLVQPFLGTVRPDLPPDLVWERGEGQQVRFRLVEVGRCFRELGLERVDDLLGLVVDRVGVGLFEDGAQQGGDPGLGAFRDLIRQVTRVVKP